MGGEGDAKRDGTEVAPDAAQKLAEIESKYKPSTVDSSLLEKLDVQDKVLTIFVKEYEKLQLALRKARESEHRFVQTCRETSRSIVDGEKRTAEVDGTLAKQRSHKAQITEAIAEIERKGAEAEQEKEAKAKEIESMKNRLRECEQELKDQAASLDQKQKMRVRRLEDKLIEVREVLENNKGALNKLRENNLATYEEKSKLFAAKVEIERSINAIEEQSKDVAKEVLKEKDRLAKLEAAIVDSQTNSRMRKDMIRNTNEERQRVKEQIKNERERVAHYQQNIEDLKADIERGRHEYKDKDLKIRDVRRKREVIERELEKFDKERALLIQKSKKAKREGILFRKMIEKSKKEIKETAVTIGKVEAKKEKVQGQIVELKAELKDVTFRLGLKGKERDTLKTDRELLKTEREVKDTRVKQKISLEQYLRLQLKSIENDFKGYQFRQKHLYMTIDRIHMEIEMRVEETKRRVVQRKRATEVAQRRENEIQSLKLKIEEAEARLKAVTAMVAQCKAEKSVHAKTLSDQQQELREYNRTFAEVKVQIRSYKQEIQDKDIAILTEHLNLKHTRERVKSLMRSCDGYDVKIKAKEEILKVHAAKIVKITKILEKAEDELQVQRKQYSAIASEQKLLDQQLMAKKVDITKLRKQLKLQHAVLRLGETAYSEKLKEIMVLKRRRDEIQSTFDAYVQEIEAFAVLKAEVRKVQHEVLKEEVRKKALSEEMKRTINIHRWRHLRETDTEAYNKIMKVHRLQKKIMSKTSKAAERDKMILEREKLYVELRRVLARQPGPEANEQLEQYASVLKEKKSKLRKMKKELKMYQARVFECKYDIEKVARDMNMLKQDYFHTRLREAKAQQRRALAPPSREDNGDDMSGLEAFYRANPQHRNTMNPPTKSASRMPGSRDSKRSSKSRLSQRTASRQSLRGSSIPAVIGLGSRAGPAEALPS